MLIRSYKSAFILLFVVLLVTTVSGVAYNAYRRASTVSLDLSANTIAEISDKVVRSTVEIFTTARSYLEVNALIVGDGDIVERQDYLLNIFWTQIHLNPQLLSLYAADARGSFVQARELPQLVTRVIDRRGEKPSEQLIYRDRNYRPIAHINGGALYDPRERPWYGSAGTDGETRLSPVYRFTSTEKLGITATRAITRGDGEVIGVLGADIALEGLSEFLAEQRIAAGGVAMIVDPGDRLVAFPYQLRLKPREDGTAYEGPPLVADLADSGLVDAYTDLKAVTARDEDDGRDYAVSESGGARYIAHVADFPPAFAGWRLFIVVPETALLSSANRLLTESFVISLIILAAAVFLVYSLASRFFEPVRRLAENTRMIRAFRFEEVRPVRSRFLEIQDMDESLLGMKQGLLAFERFVPKELAHQLIESGAEVTPGGEVRELTIFLSGMSGFSSLCRSLPPEGVVEVLTERFEQQTRIILRERGTLDKFLIDTVMAFWGAPVAMDDGPERACRAALTCLRAETSPIPNRNRRYARSPSLFAIHTGPAIVGNIGSASRMNYTAIGENVEFAWKLKQLNRLYGTRILVSGAARQEIVDRFWWRMVDVLPLEDLDMEIELFELIEQRSLPLTADMEDFIKDYEAGLAHVRANEWDAGTAVFESLSRTHPEDGSVALMLHRCQTRDAQRCPEIGPVKDASDFEGNL